MSIWLITGCSSGLGKGIAQAVLKRGEKAAVTARNIQALQEFEEQYPSQVLALEMDLNEAESMKQAVAKTREHFETNFYGKGLLGTEHKIPDYDVLGEKYRKELLVNHHDQAGDSERGGEVIVETVLGQKQPFRLLLGKDAAMAAESEMEKRLEEIREWKEVSSQSDYR